MSKKVEYFNEQDEIISVDILNSSWKINKLAFVYHLLVNPSDHYIRSESVQKAIDFYKQSHLCLVELLTKKAKSDIENMFNFFMGNINKMIPLMALRNEKFVNGREFSKWFKESLPFMILMAEERGLCFISHKIGSIGNEFCLYNPQKYRYDEERGMLATVDGRRRAGVLS